MTLVRLVQREMVMAGARSAEIAELDIRVLDNEGLDNE